MPNSPFTAIGRVEQEVMDIKRQLGRKIDEYKITEINSKTSSLEREIREISTKVDGIFTRLQILEEDKLVREQELK